MSRLQLPPHINKQRVIALALMLLECVVVVMFARTWTFPGIVFGGSVLGFATRWRIDFDRKLTFNLAVILWIVMFGQYALLPSNPRYNELFAGQQVAYLLAQYFMSVQAAYFFILRRDNLVPSSFVLLGAGSLACLAIVQLRHNFERPALQALHAGFVVGALWFWSASRRLLSKPPSWFSGRSLLSGFTVVIITASGCGIAWLMARYETQLDRWVMSLLDFEKPTTEVGFAETSRIGAVRFNQSQNANQIALRVTADFEPGYFRGKVYDSYFDREWHLALSGLPLERVNPIPASVSARAADGPLFKLVNSPTATTQAMTVISNPGLGGVYFAPLATVFLQGPRGAVIRDQHNVLRADDRQTPGSYKLFVSATTSNEPLHASRHAPQDATRLPVATPVGKDFESSSAFPMAPELEVLLFVPRSIREDARVLAVRDEVFRDATDARSKIAAVEKYFSSYRYALNVAPPAERDPVGWFLTEKPDAHCEYFGSATVMLLRLAGVPSRYVTGFVVDEQNSITGEYVARQKDAHAWAEARLEDGRWELVETTPAAGLPSQNGPAEDSNLWEALVAKWEQWRQDVADRGIEAVLRDALIPVLIVVAVGSLAGAVVLGWRRYRRVRRERDGPLYLPHLLERELRTYDRKVGRYFRPRAAHETLSQYAAALDANANAVATSEEIAARDFDFSTAAMWYRSYEQRRFQSALTNDPTMANP